MRCIHGCCVSSTHCLLMHIPASDRYKSLWTLETHWMPFSRSIGAHFLTSPLWNNGMRLLLPLIWNSLFISSWITLQRLHCGLGLLVDPLCVDTYFDSSQERNATTLDILLQFTTAIWNAIREFPEDSPRWLRSPTPCSPRLHTWHGLSSQYHHLGDPIRITRFYYSHKRRDWTGRLTLTRSRGQDQLIDILPINNWSTPVGQQLILSDVPRCLPC